MPRIDAIQGAPGTTDNDGGAHIFGNDFKVNAACTIDAVWTYHTSSNEPNSVTVQVHRQSNQEQLALKTTATSGFTDNAWNRVALDTPVDYDTPDELITVSNFWPSGAGGGFVYTTDAEEHEADGLTAMVGSIGRFKNASAVLGDYPNQTFAGLANAVGIEVTFAEGGEDVTGTAVILLGALTAAATGLRTVLGTAVAGLGGLAGASSGLRTATGTAVAALGGVAIASGSRSVFGAGAAGLGALTAGATQEGAAVVVAPVAGGGWYDLLAIEQEMRQMLDEERNRVPVAGPMCGEPLRAGPNGQLFCPFDQCYTGRG